MYERFSDELRRVFAVANRIAQGLNYEEIGPEHILLAILDMNDSLAVATLTHLGVNLEDLRLKIKERLPPGPEMVVMGKLPQSKESKLFIQPAIDEAMALNCNYVGTEHMLIVLFDVDSSVKEILESFGLTREKVKDQVFALSQPALQSSAPVSVPSSSSTASQASVFVFSIILAPEMEWTMAKMVEIQMAFEERAKEATAAGRRLEARTFTEIAATLARIIREEFGAEEHKASQPVVELSVCPSCSGDLTPAGKCFNCHER